jgi:hypothetical protein
MAGSLALDTILIPESSREPSRQISTSHGAHSPAFLSVHAIVLVLGFWLIYITREKKQYYLVRVVFCGMLLGGLLSEILDFFVPLHR